MKKTAAFLILFIGIMLIPVITCANGPGPSPYNTYIAVDDCSDIKEVRIIVSEEGVEYTRTTVLKNGKETRRKNEKIFYYYNEDGQYISFKLEVAFTDGSLQRSNAIDFGHSYLYDVENNLLQQGAITSQKLGFGLMFIPFMLVLPLIVTLMVEWGVSCAFRLDPGKYVVIANLVTNPIMNILLLVIYTISCCPIT